MLCSDLLITVLLPPILVLYEKDTSSPYTGSVRTQEYDGVYWEAEVSLPPMRRETALEWQSFLLNLSGKFYAKDKQWYQGNYMFTVDNCAADEYLDMGDSENPEDHKSYNFLELDNGQYAAQPNNRCIFLDAASNPKEMLFPDFKVCTKKYIVEQNPKWAIGDADTVMYE